MGQLIPVVCEQIIPGDRFRVGLTYQMQLAPMLNPVYDGLEVNFEAFFVPNRILDRKWREFWTGYNEYDQMTPVEVAPLKLQLGVEAINYDGDTTTGYLEDWSRDDNPPLGTSSLLDFLGYQLHKYGENGVPYSTSDGSSGGLRPYSTRYYTPYFNALPVLAYNRIWDDWYRNERTQRASLYRYYNDTNASLRTFASLYSYDAEDGSYIFSDSSVSSVPCELHYRNYKKDRFTTALPEPIIGGDVHIPVNDGLSVASPYGSDAVIEGSSSDGYNLNALALGTIQQLKLALKEYQYRMKDTYNGNRYVESLYAHYGIVVPDSTLQRSIYLGSGRDYVNFGEVYQTSSGDGEGSNGALGDYAGRGAGAGTHYLFDESFYEPGFFFVLMSISPRSRYFQGVKRFFTRYDRDDYFSPEYQNIGDDFIEVSELYNNSLYSDPAVAVNSGFDKSVFGFNSRWLEFKVRHDELHGDFANANSPMFNWNFARAFENAPLISPEFSSIRPINKPFVDLSDTYDNFFVDVAVKMDALRPILAVESF